MEPEFYVRNRTGELMSRCTNDLNSVRMVLGPGIMYSANTFATMVLAVVLMFWISPRLSIYVLLPVPVVAVTVWVFGRQIHALYGKNPGVARRAFRKGTGEPGGHAGRTRLRAGGSRDSRL